MTSTPNATGDVTPDGPTGATTQTETEFHVLGEDIRGLEISTKADNIRDGKPVFMLMGAHHAREWPSSEHTIEFAFDLLDRAARLPLVPVPRGWRIQPIDADEVARRLAQAVGSGPAGRLPDLGGPEVFPVADLVRAHLAEVHRRRPVVELPVPGTFAAAMRSGANLVPGNRAGGRTWQEFLATRPHSLLEVG